MKIMFAGGGTGGHLMAGVSIAEEISARFPDTDIIFLGTNRKKEAAYVERSGYKFKQIKMHKLTSFAYLPVFAFVSIIGIILSLVNIIKIKPDIIIGLGGYGSVLPVIAAYIARVPIVLIEQNVIPGRANQLMARWVDAVLCHWEGTAKRFKRANSLYVTGIPIRRNIMINKASITNNTLGLDIHKKTLLVMGGSQGAHAINKVMLQSIPGIKSLIPELQIIHLTGKPGYKEAKAAYDKMGIKAFVTEFLDNIGIAYGLSDLIVCRAGANSTAEISAVGIPAIFIPYPYATDDHQYWNAYEIAKSGGAVIVKQEGLGPEKIIELVSDLLMNDEKLDNMKRTNKGLGKPYVSNRVVDKIFQILKVKKNNKNIIPVYFRSRYEIRKCVQRNDSSFAEIL